MGIMVAAQADVVLLLRAAESVVAMDDAGEAFSPEFHDCLL
jgi:hypothetical protein